MLTNTAIARAIAMLVIATRADLRVEEVDNNQAPYEGVMVYVAGTDERVLHIYLNDDDKNVPLWMVDPSNVATGDVDPMLLTADSLQFGVEFLTTDAWLLTDADGNESITTDRFVAAKAKNSARQALTNKPGGTLVAYLDPTTGDLVTDADKTLVGNGSRFSRPLFTPVV